MELIIHFNTLPERLTLDMVKDDLAGLLEDDGWLTGSGPNYLELELEDPIAYVQDLYKKDKSAEISSSEKDGALIVEVVCEAAQRHRYTFSEV